MYKAKTVVYKNIPKMPVCIWCLLALKIVIFKREEHEELLIWTLIRHGFVVFSVTVVPLLLFYFLLKMDTEFPFKKNQHLFCLSHLLIY